MRNPESEISKPPRESAVSRVAGLGPEDEAAIFKYFKYLFEKQPPSKIEREKTPEELKFIEDVNVKLREFVEGYGGEWIKVNPKNIHFVEFDKLPPETREVVEKNRRAAFFIPENQSITFFIKSGYPKLYLASTIAHELLHFNSYYFLAGKKTEKDKTKLKRVRSGLIVRPDNKSVGLFHSWNEAVNTELQIRFEDKFFKDLDYTKEDAEEREMIRERYRIRGQKEFADNLVSPPSPGQPDFYVYSYESQRKELWALINVLYKQNKEQFKAPEDVFDIFARAATSDDIKPLAGLIEKNFGAGAFKGFGEITAYKPPQEKKG